MINSISKQKVLAIMIAIDKLSEDEKQFMLEVAKITREKGNRAAAELFL